MKVHPEPSPTPPRFLFHVTRPVLVESIQDEGLIGSPFVFMSESVEDCLTFTAVRLGSYITYSEERELTGVPDVFRKEVAAGRIYGARIDDEGRVMAFVPTVERNDRLAVFKIDTTLLDPDRLSVSDDHAAFVFGDVTSWMHLGDVPPEALVEVTTVPIGEPSA